MPFPKCGVECSARLQLSSTPVIQVIHWNHLAGAENSIHLRSFFLNSSCKCFTVSKIPWVSTDPWNFAVSLPFLAYACDAVNCELKPFLKIQCYMNLLVKDDSNSSAYRETSFMKLGYTCASRKEKTATWFAVLPQEQFGKLTVPVSWLLFHVLFWKFYQEDLFLTTA